jgi:hypothetical protein
MPESRPLNNTTGLLTMLASTVKSPAGSGAAPASPALAASSPEALMMPSVLPSGRASRIARAPTMPPASGRFSPRMRADSSRSRKGCNMRE